MKKDEFFEGFYFIKKVEVCKMCVGKDFIVFIF